MKKVILTKGLPASGKSTWAKEMVAKGGWKRINKDDLRAMLDNGKWSKESEELVIKTRDRLIMLAIIDGYNVIVDDTNLHPKHLEHIKQLVKDHAKVEVKEFDTPIEECIKRDLARPNSVGEKVIRRMYKQFIDKPVEAPKINPKLSSAVICDIDGTLAIMGNRSPFDWHRVGEDKVNETVRRIINRFEEHHDIILVSGRDSVCEAETRGWLCDNEIYFDLLFMRQEGDTRKDAIIKQEIYEQKIKDKYNILFVLDDRKQVVEMWRRNGLTCLQVAEGDF